MTLMLTVECPDKDDLWRDCVNAGMVPALFEMLAWRLDFVGFYATRVLMLAAERYPERLLPGIPRLIGVARDGLLLERRQALVAVAHTLSALRDCSRYTQETRARAALYYPAAVQAGLMLATCTEEDVCAELSVRITRADGRATRPVSQTLRPDGFLGRQNGTGKILRNCLRNSRMRCGNPAVIGSH